MSELNPSNELLLIRCPSCGQRFNVDEEYRGRLVECGECDHQFEINDASILRGKKFYPGERKDSLLENVHRVDKPIPQVKDALHDFEYASQSATSATEPTSPLRALLGVLGVFVMIVTAAFLVMGAARGGVLDGVTTERRLIMAAFSGLLGLVLLIYANPKSRIAAIVVGVLLVSGLGSLPFFFTEGSTPIVANEDEIVYDHADADEGDDDDELTEEEVAQLVGLDPLEKEISRLENEGSPLSAVGVWLRNYQISNRYLIRDYFVRETASNHQVNFYNRGVGSTLMVVSGIDKTPDQVALVASALGKVKNVYHGLKLVEVVVNNERFIPGPVEKLTDPDHPEYYLLNKIELECVDLDRVSSAVKRLSEAEPALFRKDISRRLIDLLRNDWVDFKDHICRALLVWAEESDLEAGKVALKEMKRILAQQQSIPEAMVALAVKQKADGLESILYAMWLENPSLWEKWLAKLGPSAEQMIIEKYAETSDVIRQSAIRVLGEIGGKARLELLEKESEIEDEAETKILLRNAIREINVRLIAR